jgi:hypothetical protein
VGDDCEARIAGCTRVVRLATDSQARAAALDNRGDDKAGLGDLGGAIADFNEANRLSPEFEGPISIGRWSGLINAILPA